MLRVFHDAGCKVTTRVESGVVRVEFPLIPTPESVAAIEGREHHAEAASIARLLRPRSIAVVGAGRRAGSIGHELFVNLLRHGFNGPVYPVNPSAHSIASVRAWPRLLDVPDVGAVALDLVGADEVRAAYERMSKAVGDAMRGAIVQPMAEPGIETIVGVAQDPAFGPLVMFGLGGVAAELLGDVAFRVAPLTDLDAQELVREPRSSPLLFGYRGAPAAAVDVLIDLLLRVGALADEQSDIAELDLNPVRVSTGAAIVLDARVRVARAPTENEVRRLR